MPKSAADGANGPLRLLIASDRLERYQSEMFIRFATAFIASILSSVSTFAQTPTARPRIALVEAHSISSNDISDWKKEGFNAVAVVLNEATPDSMYAAAAKAAADAKLDVYYWIEIGRNAEMATKNPTWMAGLGSHTDWQKNFPKFPEPGVNQVAKAFPWVPIVYAETFNAHLKRIDQLLKRVPGGWTGVLLNDLQGGPSSCGCGNLQCRWAVDYYVSTTATKLEGDDVAARFVAEVRKHAGGKSVIPVWTTECSEVDLPSSKNGGHPSTGFCGDVGCAHSACAQVFSAQWTALTATNSGLTAILGTHTSFGRVNPELGGGPTWVTNAVSYINTTLPSQGGKAIAPDRLWVVIDGVSREDEAKAREAADKIGVGGVIVAKIKIDQNYEPRMLRKN